MHWTSGRFPCNPWDIQSRSGGLATAATSIRVSSPGSRTGSAGSFAREFTVYPANRTMALLLGRAHRIGKGTAAVDTNPTRMKIILSRKGFDSSVGGCASPILPDGKMLSLPIPTSVDVLAYGEIRAPDGETWLSRYLRLSGSRTGYHGTHAVRTSALVERSSSRNRRTAAETNEYVVRCGRHLFRRPINAWVGDVPVWRTADALSSADVPKQMAPGSSSV